MKNKKGNIAVITLIIVIVAVTAGVIGFLFAKKIETPAAPVVAIQQPVAQSINNNDNITAKYSPPFVYKNDKYRFALTLPGRWKEYRVEEKESQTDGSKYLLFELPTASGDYYRIFDIDVFTKKEWNKNQVANDPSVRTFVAENKDYVFGYYNGNQDCGIFVGFPDPNKCDGYCAPYVDAKDDIIPSFKFVN